MAYDYPCITPTWPLGLEQEDPILCTQHGPEPQSVREEQPPQGPQFGPWQPTQQFRTGILMIWKVRKEDFLNSNNNIYAFRYVLSMQFILKV